MGKAIAKYRPGEDAFHEWREHIHTGHRDPLYAAGQGELAKFPLGPRRVTLLGGAPGQGKTALAMQLVFDALRLNTKLRACVCNVEMGAEALLDRQLARISGIDLTSIRDRAVEATHMDRIDAAMVSIEPVVERLSFVTAPFDLGNVAEVVDATGADILMLDYIQRIKPAAQVGGKASDRRGDVDATMDYLRQFAEAGMAVFVIAAVARTKNKKGQSSYDADGLGLASFRESSELEFGADDAFLLVPDKDDRDAVVLKHLKARHGEPRDLSLEFDRSLQRFTALDSGMPGMTAFAVNQHDIDRKLKDAWAGRGKK